MHLLHFSIRSSITWLVFSQNLVGQWQIIRVHIAHISHDGHDRRWCRFFRPVPLLALKRKCWPDLAIFGYFVTNLRTFWCLFKRPKHLNSVGCPKIDKYEVRECKGTTGVCVFGNYEYESFQHWRISSGDWILPTGNSQYLKLTLTGCWVNVFPHS